MTTKKANRLDRLDPLSPANSKEFLMKKMTSASLEWRPLYMELSPIQLEILRIICETKDTDFQMLMKRTMKDRITLLQSIRGLISRNLVYKVMVDPKHPKSRLIFLPRDKGLAVGLDSSRFLFEKHKKTYGLERLSSFDYFIDGISEAPFSIGMLASSLLRRNLFKKGGTIAQTSEATLEQIRFNIFIIIGANEYLRHDSFGNNEYILKIQDIYLECGKYTHRTLGRLKELGFEV